MKIGKNINRANNKPRLKFKRGLKMAGINKRFILEKTSSENLPQPLFAKEGEYLSIQLWTD
jgi:hypothetical protein